MKTLLLSVIVLASSCLVSASKEPPKDVEVILQTLLEATQENDLGKFKSVCDQNMQQAMTKDKLNLVSTQLSGPMKAGYNKEYLGVLDRVAFKTYYWKIDFDNNGVADMLAELSIIKGKTAGFFIR